MEAVAARRGQVTSASTIEAVCALSGSVVRTSSTSFASVQSVAWMQFQTTSVRAFTPWCLPALIVRHAGPVSSERSRQSEAPRSRRRGWSGDRVCVLDQDQALGDVRLLRVHAAAEVMRNRQIGKRWGLSLAY